MRSLTEEEQRLWDYVTRHDQRFHNETNIVIPDVIQNPGHRAQMPERHALRAFSPSAEMTNIALAQGAYANIDRNTAERFRKGHYPIDATLDLHGMNREKAYATLMSFVKRHYPVSRCLLVITGKGKKNSEQQGVLRESLPRWLVESDIKPMILAFDTARPKDGGEGAYYILLRRKR